MKKSDIMMSTQNHDIQNTAVTTLRADTIVHTYNKDGTCSHSISVYTDPLPTEKDYVDLGVCLTTAFPKTTELFLTLLRARIEAQGFTAQRLRDAVMHLIDNHSSYRQTFSIADIIKYDKRIRLYTMYEVAPYISYGDNPATNGQMEWLNMGNGLFARRTSLIKAGLNPNNYKYYGER